MSKALFTFGYEGAQLPEVLAKLSAARVQIVLDVRELPLSRRRGFSKTPLSAALAAAGIAYAHLRRAGNPARKLRKTVGAAAMRASYRAHLADDGGIVPLVADAARGKRAALMCFEADPLACHRSVLGARVAKRLGAKLVHL